MKIYLFISGLIALTLNLGAQTHGRGLILEDEIEDYVKCSSVLNRGDYLDLPDRFSLKKFSPTPGDQGIYSTCAGWACGYSARTILSSITDKLINPLIDQNAFSPSFIYNQIRKDSTCLNGVSLTDALEILKNEGSLKLKEFEYNCSRDILPKEKYFAKANRILDYRELFNKNSADKILVTKKSISEYKPVIIAMDIPKSFESCVNVWEPLLDEYRSWSSGHALVVISYDDSLFGGAFEVLNSWGIEWGNNGFMWIRYSDFSFFSFRGYEIIDNIKKQNDYKDLSGKLSLVLENGETIKLKDEGKYYKTVASFTCSTKFKINLSNNQPAYVYAFGTDLKKKTTILFPQNSRISPLLPYKSNNIILPSENDLLMLDKNTGKSYLCFIYSNKQLAFTDDLKRIFKKNYAIPKSIFSYYEKQTVLKKGNLNPEQDVICFDIESKDKNQIIILIEFDHIK